MVQRLLTSGSETQVNLPPSQDNDQYNPAVAALTDGRFFVAYNDDFSGTLSDVDIRGQFVNSTGTLSGGNIQVEAPSGNQTNSAVAPRTGGGATVVYLDDADSQNINWHTVTSAGVVSAEFTVLSGFAFVNKPDIAALTDGRALVVAQYTNATYDIAYNFINAAGTGIGVADFVEIGGGDQITPAVASFGNDALVVYEDNSAGNKDISAKFYNGTTFGSKITIQDAAVNVFTPDVAALADERYIVVYTDGVDIFGKIYDPFTPTVAFLSPQFRIDAAAGGIVGHPSVAGTVDGGFIVTWEQFIGSAVFDIHARRFDAHGLAFGDDFTVNSFTDNVQAFPALAVSGANVLIAWHDNGVRAGGDTDPFGVRSQAFTTTAFDYDSARFGDFNNNGRSDVLLQNDTGDIMIGETNSSGAFSGVTSIGTLPGDFRIDGVGNFNSTPGSDILLRNPTDIRIMPMNGLTAQPTVFLGSTAPDWLNSGMGDFTGDGQTDLLFRNVGSL